MLLAVLPVVAGQLVAVLSGVRLIERDSKFGAKAGYPPAQFFETPATWRDPDGLRPSLMRLSGSRISAGLPVSMPRALPPLTNLTGKPCLGVDAITPASLIKSMVFRPFSQAKPASLIIAMILLQHAQHGVTIAPASTREPIEMPFRVIRVRGSIDFKLNASRLHGLPAVIRFMAAALLFGLAL